MNPERAMWAVQLYPYIVPWVVFALFILLERMSRNVRWASLALLTVASIIPSSWSEALILLAPKENYFALTMFLGVISFIAISLIALSLAKLAKSYRRYAFVIISLLILPPIIVPAGYVAVTLNLGLVYFVLDSFSSLPDLLISAWQIHLVSFAAVGIVSTFVAVWLFKKSLTTQSS